jgi:hypothetical protein
MAIAIFFFIFICCGCCRALRRPCLMQPCPNLTRYESQCNTSTRCLKLQRAPIAPNRPCQSKRAGGVVAEERNQRATHKVVTPKRLSTSICREHNTASLQQAIRQSDWPLWRDYNVQTCPRDLEMTVTAVCYTEQSDEPYIGECHARPTLL